MFCFSNLCLCHRSIESRSSLGHLLGQWAGWGSRGGGVFPSVPGQKMSASFVRCCHLHSGGTWFSPPASLCGAVIKEGEGEAGWLPGSARVCVRACVRMCVSACVWVGRAERSHSTLERGVHTSQPRGKILHMKVQKNRSYLYFKTVNANSKPTVHVFFPLLYKYCSVKKCLLIGIIGPTSGMFCLTVINDHLAR